MKRIRRSRLTLFLSVFVAISALSPTLYAQATRGSYTTTDDVPLRSAPGSNDELITTLPKGIQINVIGQGSRIAVQAFASSLFSTGKFDYAWASFGNVLRMVNSLTQRKSELETDYFRNKNRLLI